MEPELAIDVCQIAGGDAIPREAALVFCAKVGDKQQGSRTQGIRTLRGRGGSRHISSRCEAIDMFVETMPWGPRGIDSVQAGVTEKPVLFICVFGERRQGTL